MMVPVNGHWCKFGDYLYIGMFFFFFFFLTVLLGDFELVRNSQNPIDKETFFLCSATFSTHPNTCDGIAWHQIHG